MSGTVSFSAVSFVENWGRRAINYIAGDDGQVGLAGCGLVGEQWAAPGAGSDAGPDGGSDAGTNCDNPPGDFSLASPADGAVNAALSPQLQWQVSVDPDTGDVVTYRVLVDEDSSFGSPLQYNDIGGSQFTIPDTLANDQTYYWQVFARDLCDQETGSPVFSFTTIAQCASPPQAFSLVNPANASADVSVIPTFDWTDSLDPDAGDAVTYTLQIDTADTFPAPTEFTAIADSAYTLGAPDALSSNTTYYWRVIAKDGCNNEVYSTEVYNFTTIGVCSPTSHFDTNFIGGTPVGVNVISGSIYLPEDTSAWTYQYEGDMDPTLAGWTVQAPSSWTINEITAGSLHISTIGLDDVGRYEIDPVPFNNATGWVVETRMRVVTAEGGGENACGLLIGDDNRFVRPGFLTDRVRTQDYAGEYLVDTSVFHTYRITGSGDDFKIYVDGALAIDGTGLMTISALPTRLYFGDTGSTPDSESYWDYLYYYTGGSTLPYLSPGTYTSEVVDTGTSANNIGAGATIGSTFTWPPGTTVLMRVRAGNSPDLSAIAWSPPLLTNPATIPGSITGQYFQWEAELATTVPAETPILEDVTIDYCTY